MSGDASDISLVVAIAVAAAGAVALALAAMVLVHRRRDAARLAATEAALEESRRAAEAAALAHEESLRQMGHDIRTPLSTIVGMTRLLLATSLDEDQRDEAETIRAGAESMQVVLDDAVDLARIRAGTLRLDEAPVRLLRLIGECMDKVAGVAAEKGLHLACSVDPAVPEAIVGDAGRLSRAIVNLLENAVQFTSRGDVALSVSARRLEGERHEIHVAVRDTGSGMLPEDRERLFQPPTGSGPGARRRIQGASAGMAVSKAFCERMGGRMWAESAPDRGSVFQFTIVASACVASACVASACVANADGVTGRGENGHVSNAPGRNGRAESGHVGNGAALASADHRPEGGLRVLVGEDDVFSRNLAVRMLESMGCRADVAETGLEVLAAVERTAYDVVLLDVQMPDMDGMQTAREIRRPRATSGNDGASSVPGANGRGAYGGLRVIAMTASTAPSDHEACIAAGMDRCLIKPFDAFVLRAALGIALSDTAQRSTSAPKSATPSAQPTTPPSAPPSASPSAHDAMVIDRLRALGAGGSRAVLDQLIDLYVGDAPLQIAQIRDAAAQGDAAGLARAAHRLRGSSAFIGATGLSALAMDVESRAEAGDIAAAAGALARLDAVWTETRSALLRERQR